MTWFEIATIAQFVLMGAVSIIVYVLGREREGTELKIRSVVERVSALEGRFDRAGQKMSDLTDVIHGLPERMRVIFASNERLNDVRDRLHDAIERLEDK